MNKVFSFSIFFLLGFFVNAQSIDEDGFRLLMTPSSGGTNGYELLINEKNLYVFSKKLKIENDKITFGETINTKSIKLSNRRLSKINRYIQKIKDLNSVNDKSSLIYDAWIYDFIIDGKVVIKTNSHLIQKSSELKEAGIFLKYLKKITPRCYFRAFS